MKRISNSSSSLSVASDPPLPVLTAVNPLPEAPPTQPPLYRQIKLALDVHAGDLRVVRRVDGAKPQPPQKMSYDNFLHWVVKQKSQAKEVFSCYEASPTGYWLHRKLIERGIVKSHF